MEPLAHPPHLAGAYPLLASHRAVIVKAAIDAAAYRRWADGVLGARREWTHDFEGEQFSLGRAFYTHLETDRTGEYFEDARESDARVERHAPGLQEAMRALMTAAVGGRVTPRRGWCGAGVHVFPAGAAWPGDDLTRPMRGRAPATGAILDHPAPVGVQVAVGPLAHQAAGPSQVRNATTDLLQAADYTE